MELLAEEQAQSLREHLPDCPRCSSLGQHAAQQHSDLLAAFQAFDCNHDRHREQLMAMLPHAAPGSPVKSRFAPWLQWLKEGELAMILRRRITRWAAAVSLAAASVMLVVILLTSERVVFADVVENMRQAKTMVCDVVTIMKLTKSAPHTKFLGIEEPRRGKMSMYLEGDTRAVLHEMELPESFVTVVQRGSEDEQTAPRAEAAKPPQVKVSMARTLYLEDKAYIWQAGKLQVLTSLDARQQASLEEWLKVLLEARLDSDRELGEKVIQGRRVSGFEIAGWKLKFGTRPTAGSPTPVDSLSKVQVWVDNEQNLPIQIAVDMLIVSPQMEGVVHTVFENIQWNVPLDAADFRPPSEAELAQAEVHQMPAIDEATFLKFMQAWVDAGEKAQEAMKVLKQIEREKGEPLPPGIVDPFGGKPLEEGYPKTLDANWLSGAYLARLIIIRTAKNLSDQEPLPEELEEAERKRLIAERAKESAKATSKSTQEGMTQATAAAAFYQRLANEGYAPAYFGATVRPGVADAVLLKWKIDDGRNRVIYGDLHVETVE
jgi:hypothetical protein